jgi:hypothetical protein
MNYHPSVSEAEQANPIEIAQDLIAVSRIARLGDRVAHTAVFETEKSGRLIPSLLGIAVFAVGLFLNSLAMHLAAVQN